MSRVLNEYLSLMNDIIYKHEGTIDKFIGDAIMVIFGAPTEMVSSEQVQRATQCAIGMQRRLDELNEGWTEAGIPKLQMRIGLHHGAVVVKVCVVLSSMMIFLYASWISLSNDVPGSVSS